MKEETIEPEIFAFIWELVDVLKVMPETEDLCQYTLLRNPEFREHVDHLIEVIEFFRESFYKFPKEYCKNCSYWKEEQNAS